MKKDRNAFFSEYGYNTNMMVPGNMPNQNMMGNTISANSNFYSGPAIQHDERNTNYPFTAPAATPLIICF